MKLILRLNKLDSNDKTAIAEFGNDYDKILTEVEYDLKKKEENPPKEEPKKVLKAAYFNMSPFRVINNVPFRSRSVLI